MTFIVFLQNGKRQQYSNMYDECTEEGRDAAWDDVYDKFPDAEYIEPF